jgi:uncharacterized protein (DUF1778 family)
VEIMHSNTIEKSGRTARLEARITDAQKEQFQRAAELQGRSLSDSSLRASKKRRHG